MCITYDAVARQVWLDPILGGHPNGQPLCGEHAQRLNAPRGWVVVDRRDDPVVAPPRPVVVPVAKLTAAAAAAVLGGGARLPRRWGQIEESRPRFEAPIGVPAVAAVPPEEPPPSEQPPDETAAVEAVVDEQVLGNVAAPPRPEPEPEPEPENAETPSTTTATKKKVATKSSRPRRRAGADALLAPKGTLLSRAFEAGGDQRSAITVRGDEESTDG